MIGKVLFIHQRWRDINSPHDIRTIVENTASCKHKPNVQFWAEWFNQANYWSPKLGFVHGKPFIINQQALAIWTRVNIYFFKFLNPCDGVSKVFICGTSEAQWSEWTSQCQYFYLGSNFAVFGKFSILFWPFLLGKFSLLHMAKYWKIILPSGHTGCDVREIWETQNRKKKKERNLITFFIAVATLFV